MCLYENNAEADIWTTVINEGSNWYSPPQYVYREGGGG